MQLARVLVFAALLKLISGIGNAHFNFAYFVSRTIFLGTCSPPWTLYSSNCYLYAGQKKTWLDANDICLKINAQLPMVKTDSDWTALNSFRFEVSNVIFQIYSPTFSDRVFITPVTTTTSG